MKFVKKTICAVAIIGVLTGCQSTSGSGDKQTMGTVIGAGGGALLGALFGKGKGRILGVLAGAALGGLLGNQIGAKLDEEDQKKLAEESAKALTSVKDGQTVSWNNPDTGTTGTLTPKQTLVSVKETRIVRTRRVQITPNMQMIGAPYMAVKNANVRAAPTKNAEKLDSLKSGDQVQALGRVPNQDWIMVARDQTAIGYVYAPLLSEAQMETTGGGGLRTQEESKAMFGDLSGSTEVVEDTLIVQTQCRTLSFDVKTKDGDTNASEFEACKQSDGAWEIS